MGPGGREAVLGSLDDQVVLELSDRRQHVEEETPARSLQEVSGTKRSIVVNDASCTWAATT